MTTIGAILPYYGSKRTLAPRIVAELGPHSAYWEPFCGSAAVIMAKPRAAMETMNDLYGDLINLARVLASDAAAALYARCRRTLAAQDLFAEAQDEIRKDGPVADSVAAVKPAHVERAYWFLIESWQGRNGVAGTVQTNRTCSRRYTPNGGHGATRWKSATESIPAWHERLRDAIITREDGLTLLEKLEDHPATAIYCDPPYFLKSDKYVHDFATADHARLAEALARFRRARVVVSYYDHAALAELYPSDRWSKVECPTTKNSMQAARRGQTGRITAPEVLLTNGPSFSTPAAAEPAPGLFAGSAGTVAANTEPDE